jgi:hypothetical protein
MSPKPNQTEPIKLNLPKTSKWAEYWAVQSASRPEVEYIIAKAHDGAFGCSCPRWKFKREFCKHIQQVQAFELIDPMEPKIIELSPARVANIEKALSRFSFLE